MSISSKTCSSAFISHCKLFLTELANRDIIVGNARKFMYFHGFEGKQTNDNTKRINEIVEGFLDGKLMCESEEIDDISQYYGARKKKELKTLQGNDNESDDEEEKKEINIKIPKITKEMYEKFIYILLNITTRVENYYKIDSRKRRRDLAKNIDPLKDIREVITVCGNKIPVTHPQEFFKMINELATKGYLLLNYQNNTSNITIVCKELHHYSCAKGRYDTRIKEKRNICGICGEDNNHINNYYKTKSSNTKERMIEYLQSIGVTLKNYDQVNRIVKTNCPICKKDVELYQGNVLGWKGCIQCSNVACGNKYTQKEINEILEKRGIYKSETYQSKDIPIKFHCPSCETIMSMRLYEIRTEDIQCATCQYNHYTYSKILKIANIYGVDLSESMKYVKSDSVNILTSIKLNYSKGEKKIMDQYNIDQIADFYKLYMTLITTTRKTKTSGISMDAKSFEKMKRNSATVKPTSLPDGTILYLQGDEPKVVQLLIKIGITDIISSAEEMTMFKYRTNDGKNHNYYPDLYVPKKNLIIEVKSIYTYYKDAYTNTLKLLSAVLNGYNVQLWITQHKRVYLIHMSYHNGRVIYICKTIVTLSPDIDRLQKIFKNLKKNPVETKLIDNYELTKIHGELSELVATLSFAFNIKNFSSQETKNILHKIVTFPQTLKIADTKNKETKEEKSIYNTETTSVIKNEVKYIISSSDEEKKYVISPQLEKSTKEIKEYLKSIGTSLVQYNLLTTRFTTYCPVCEGEIEIPRAKIRKWKRCTDCRVTKGKKIISLQPDEIVIEAKVVKKEKKGIVNTGLEYLDDLFQDGTFYIPKDMVIKIYDSNRYEEILDRLVILSPQFPSGKDFIEVSKIKSEYTSLHKNNVLIVDNEIKNSTSGKHFLNYFFLDVILEAVVGRNMFYDVWNNSVKRRDLWHKTLKVKYDDKTLLQPMSIISKFGYANARAYNFAPHVAKCIYNSFHAKRVLDFCSGYGGRLLGFYVSEAEEYIGIDPNTHLKYQEMVNWLEDYDDLGKKITMINKPAEDVDYSKLGKFDMIFTSPPYYDLEKYSTEKTQSYIRYSSYKSWKDKFLNTVINKVITVLEEGGYLLINIKNTPDYKIADDMVKYINSLNLLTQKDSILMIQAKKIKGGTQEYIYVWEK